MLTITFGCAKSISPTRRVHPPREIAHRWSSHPQVHLAQVEAMHHCEQNELREGGLGPNWMRESERSHNFHVYRHHFLALFRDFSTRIIGGVCSQHGTFFQPFIFPGTSNGSLQKLSRGEILFNNMEKFCFIMLSSAFVFWWWCYCRARIARRTRIVVAMDMVHPKAERQPLTTEKAPVNQPSPGRTAVVVCIPT